MKTRATKKQFYMHKISNFLNVQKIVTIHYQKPERNYVSQEESHNFWELMYVDKEEIIIVKDAIKTHYNDDGILILNLFDFLLEENCLEN